MTHIYDGILAIKRNEIELFVVRWMNTESVIQTEVSQKEKNKYCMLTYIWNLKKKNSSGTSLVAQWLGICLSMQGTQVRSLVWEDPTCRGAAKPVCHNY